jgi:hypothetical protein
MAADAPRHRRFNVASKSRQRRGSPALPDIHMTGDSAPVVASRSTTIFCATAGLNTLGSCTETDAITVGSASEATMAVIQIQRVLARLRRAARSARNAPIDSSKVTMITYSIQASI